MSTHGRNDWTSVARALRSIGHQHGPELLRGELHRGLRTKNVVPQQLIVDRSRLPLAGAAGGHEHDTDDGHKRGVSETAVSRYSNTHTQSPTSRHVHHPDIPDLLR